MWAAIFAALVRAGHGCTDGDLGLGTSHTVKLSVAGDGERSFDVRMPQTANTQGHDMGHKKEHAVAFFFHGQFGDPAEQHREHVGFEHMSLSKNVITVTPAGALDTAIAQDGTKTQFTSWNVGAKHDDTICDPAVVKDSGYPACMESCKSGCGACDWSTCHDDVEFVRSMLDYLDAHACIDTTKLFLYGESNGAMLVYHLLQAMPGVFAAAVPVEGLPLRGNTAYLPGETADHAEQAGAAGFNLAEFGGTAIMHWAGSGDTLMPLDGMALSSDGFKYASLDDTLARFGDEMGCTALGTPVEKKTDWIDTMKCDTHGSCPNGNQIIACTYAGEHGDLPRLSNTALDGRYDAMLRWFFGHATNAAPRPWRSATPTSVTEAQLRLARPAAVAVDASGALQHA